MQYGLKSHNIRTSRIRAKIIWLARVNTARSHFCLELLLDRYSCRLYWSLFIPMFQFLCFCFRLAVSLIKSFVLVIFPGLPNTSGLIARKGVISSQDAAVIVAMRRAGAIPIAVTNVSELCMWYESSNLLYGRSNNAYHQGRIVGGSSGKHATCDCWVEEEFSLIS